MAFQIQLSFIFIKHHCLQKYFGTIIAYNATEQVLLEKAITPSKPALTPRT